MPEHVLFIRDAFLTYAGGNYIWILYAAALLYILLFSEKRRKMFLLLPLLALALTVFNPLLTGLFVRTQGMRNRYPRFFWMLVFYITIAYACTQLIFRLKGILKVAGAAAAVALICLIGKPVFLSADAPDYHPAENAAFVRSELIELNAAFHEGGHRVPRVLYGAELMTTYRVYDPTVRSILSKKRLTQLEKCDEETFVRRHEDPDNAIWQVFYYEDFSVDQERFQKALSDLKIHYIAPVKTSAVCSYLDEAGLQRTAETMQHYVYRVL
ncbi:MAG: hypothetical protein IJX90_05350 [Blautia sp.]|nr:hypothetical protein [Blautia sp.]